MTQGAATGALASRRVLVVEDEYFLADDMAKALEQLGATVVGPVPTVERALDLAAHEAVDGAVLDINLKGRAVFPVAEALQQRGVPFVFATGYDRAAIPPEYGEVPRWEKPFRPEDLAKVLPTLMQST